MKVKHVFGRRGQTLVLFALMIPIIMLFVGLALDLGWYYLNVSRLQNAADAAALAGAQAINENSQDAFGIQYYGKSLVSNKLPEDFDHYENVFNHGFGELNNYKPVDDIKEFLLEGRNHVEEYTRKNLADSNVINADTSADWKVASATDGWNISASDEDKQVNGSIELKYKLVDGKNDKYGQLYYVVTLSEKIRHFFLPGWFDDMVAPVRAVVLLEPHDTDLLSAMWKLERTKVIDNWEYQNYYKNGDGFYYAGKWNHYQAGNGTDKTKGVKYSDGDSYRTESVVVKTQDRTKDSDSSGIQTSATNDRRFYGVNEVDSINIDFRAEILKKFTTDWDIGQAVKGQSYDFTEGWSAMNGADKRILFNAEFDEAFPTRDATQLADVLWTRIESDPIKDISYIPDKAGHTSYNSVRQITLNFNTDNTEKIASGENAGHYKYRPYCVFYTGPEIIDYATDSNGVRIRHSQPVVVNLNANLNAILFMPNSPVIINGNNHDWTGFIIAKCFLTTVTSSDMTSGTTVTLTDGYTTKTLTGNYTAGTDGYGQTVYVHTNELYTAEQIYAEHAALMPVVNATTENVVFVYNDSVKKQILLSFTADDFATCTTAAEFYAKFASIVNSTYKDKFQTFSGLDDSQITAVTFPDENYNFTGATYYVATADLYDSDPDPKNANNQNDKHVKVLLPDGTAKYVAKAKLPYVKVRMNKEYHFVCVYDLKLAWKECVTHKDADYSGFRIVDDNFSDAEANVSYRTDSSHNKATMTNADVFKNPEDKWYDSWGIKTKLYTDVYKGKYSADNFIFAQQNGVKYFMLKLDVDQFAEGRYHKVTVNGTDLYIKEGTTYYTKVQNNPHNEDNYIIVDQSGNILTKELPEDSTRLTNSREKPLDDKLIEDRDYEVVYVDPNDQSKPPFKLKTVEYSSFAVPELKRKIYKYLDDGGSVDMFFTTIRAGWVD